MTEKKRGILVVSFGTNYEETRKQTIEQIENDIRETYPQYPLYRAWTSGMIRKKLLQRDGLRIFDVREALEQMRTDGISEVIVQPTHMLNGIENDRMRAEVSSYEGKFTRLAVGDPLLTSQEDNERVIEAVAQELHLESGEALVLMGHGTEHFANSVYAALDYQFKDMGYENIFMGTVESYPSLNSLIRRVKKTQPQRVVLAPFMIVAGDHATNDLAGEEADSWKSRFEKAGFAVRCVLKGLGEYPAVRDIFLTHTARAMEQIENR